MLDSNGVGVVLVALAAPGLCWYEKSRDVVAMVTSKISDLPTSMTPSVCPKHLQQDCSVEFLNF